MIKQILFISSLLISVISMNAQPLKDSTANELNNYFKPVKWRSIGPFRGGRSVASTGVVGNIIPGDSHVFCFPESTSSSTHIIGIDISYYTS